MGQTVHTYPVHDLIAHDTETEQCICGPSVEFIPCEGEPDGWHILHNSLDGRETTEHQGGGQ